MATLSPHLFSPPPVAAIDEESRVLLKAARLWVMLARAGRSARPPLAALLGRQAATSFGLLMDALTSAWPDPFTTYPPCADSISPDEHCLLGLLALAERGTEPAFHTCLADMLALPIRERLWRSATALMTERIAAG